MVSRKSNFFATEHLRSDLKGRSARGGIVTMASQVGILLLRIVSTAILARLLSPDDFGLIAMVVTVTAFADLFKDIGLSMATIQRKTITHEQVSNLFWVNFLAGSLTMLVVVLVSPLIAWFYGDSRLLGVAMVLSVNFIFGGLTMQHQALLRRQMQFGKVALVEIVALAVSLAVTVTLALQWRDASYSYMALVAMPISRAFLLMVGMWVLCRWIPGLPRRGTGVRSMLKYGAGITGFNIVNYFARNFDRILIGKLHGAIQLGFYSKAYQFLLLPIQQLRTPIVSVATPALSALQHEPVEYRNYMKMINSLLAFMTMPLMVFCAVYADLFVLVFFGDQWVEAIPIFRVMSILGIIQPVAGMCGLVLMTLGKSKKYFYYGVINSSMLVLSFLLGIHAGAYGVAVAYTLMTYIIVVPVWKFCFSDTPVSVRLFLESIKLPGGVSLVLGVLLCGIHLFIPLSIPPYVELVGAGLVGCIFYLAIYCATGEGRSFILKILSYIMVMRKPNGNRK